MNVLHDFFGLPKTHQLTPLGPIHPSSPFTKELHALVESGNEQYT